MKRSSLQKGVSKFIPNNVYRIGSRIGSFTSKFSKTNKREGDKVLGAKSFRQVVILSTCILSTRCFMLLPHFQLFLAFVKLNFHQKKKRENKELQGPYGDC
jgi:hypothetical protein